MLMFTVGFFFSDVICIILSLIGQMKSKTAGFYTDGFLNKKISIVARTRRFHVGTGLDLSLRLNNADFLL